MSHNEAITCLLQIVTYTRLWRKNGRSKEYKGSTMIQACSWWKGTSQDEVMLISEEIESLALAILELCLSESISK